MKNEKRNTRAVISEETLAIVEAGFYEIEGKRIEIKRLIEHSVSQTELILPEQHENINPSMPNYKKTTIEVMNETTLEGAKRLSDSKKFKRIGVLNFASAKNAGGGFLGGSQAQEESLARNSALYETLKTAPTYYDYHRRKNKSLLYSDHMIYSADCPVFRLDDGTLLDEPYLVDFITAPAPNRGATSANQPFALEKLDVVFEQRIEYLLRLAVSKGCDTLVLGAWGCGVFRNIPEDVAKFFANKLLENGEFAHAFEYISFSIPENPKVAKNTMAFKSFFIPSSE